MWAGWYGVFRFSGKWASVSVSLGLFCLLPVASCHLPEVPCQPLYCGFKSPRKVAHLSRFRSPLSFGLQITHWLGSLIYIISKSEKSTTAAGSFREFSVAIQPLTLANLWKRFHSRVLNENHLAKCWKNEMELIYNLDKFKFIFLTQLAIVCYYLDFMESLVSKVF